MQNTKETIAKYAVDANLFQLGYINSKKKLFGLWMYFGGERSPPPKENTTFFTKMFKFK